MGAFEVEHCACEAGRRLVGGWHVTLAYAVGFFVMLAVLGWHPNPPHRARAEAYPIQSFSIAS